MLSITAILANDDVAIDHNSRRRKPPRIDPNTFQYRHDTRYLDPEKGRFFSVESGEKKKKNRKKPMYLFLLLETKERHP